MTWNDIFTDTFKSLSERLGHCPSRQSMVEQCLSEHSDLCRTAVERGWLTSEQMSEAARRYLLGRSKSGRNSGSKRAVKCHFSGRIVPLFGADSASFRGE